MPNPTVNDVHPGGSSQPVKPAPALNDKQLIAVLRRLLAQLSVPRDEEDEATEKAYPNTHSARQLDPDTYKVVGSKEIAPGVRMLFALKDGKSVAQSIHFDATKFTVVQARAWLKAHDYSAAQFTAAGGEVAEKDDAVEKARNIADYLISVIHRSFTTTADDMFGDGVMEQEERITLSSAIGDVLDLFNKIIDEKLPQLRQRDLAMPVLYKGDGVDIEFTAEIVAKSDDRHLAYAVVYTPGVVDSQMDFIVPDQVEAMAHRWLLKSRRYDFQHKSELPSDAAVPVESYIAPTDFTLGSKSVKQGSWVVVSYISNDELWSLVKNGTIKAYSIRGRGKRSPKPLLVA